MEPLLSIIIPTRDREKYCISCVEYMLSVFPLEVQFVIQDNSVSELISEWKEEHNRENVTYNHIYEPLSPIDNFNKAIELARGKYIIFVGDDDIVLPNAFDLVKWADSEGVDSIAQKRNVSYLWPNGCRSGELLEPYVPNSEAIERCDLKKCLANYLMEGCCDNPRLYHLPSFYHGIIKRTILDNIKKDTGDYLGGLSSDSYSATALSFYVTNHIEINKFFTIPGACPSSTTVANMQRAHCGELSMAPHLQNRKNYKWHVLIPEYYSIQTIWSESVLQALNDTNHNDYLRYFSSEDLFTRAFVLNPTIRNLIVKETSKVLDAQQRNRLSFYLKASLKVLLYIIIRNTKRVYGRLFSKRRIIKNVQDISDSVAMIPNDLVFISFK